jgi:hypothetical protein
MPQTNAKPALITAASSIVVAIITTCGTVAVTKPQAQQVHQAMKDFRDMYTGLPMGAIVASMLPPGEFDKVVENPPNFDVQKTKFVLADGLTNVRHSKYGELLHVERVPDLRGMFLRGMGQNSIEPYRYTGADTRLPGSYQSFATAQPAGGFHTESANVSLVLPFGKDMHGGKINDVGAWIRPTDHAGNARRTPVTLSIPPLSLVGADAETRPNNMAVFYYIKIN